MSFGEVERKTNCEQHPRVEELVASNNVLVSSLAGQMKILLLVLGSSAMMLSSVVAWSIITNMSNATRMDRMMITTISGVSKNRHAIERAEVDIDDLDIRVKKVEVVTHE